MKYFVSVQGREFEIDVDGDHVTASGRTLASSLERVPDTPVRQLVVDGRSLVLPVEPDGRGRWIVSPHGERYEVEVVDERTRHVRSLTGASGGLAAGGVLKAPMPGLVVRVQVEPGQHVTAGTPMIVLEAMKMENQLKATAAGVVRTIHVAAGAAVEKGKVLVEFDPPTQDSGMAGT